MHLFAHLQQNDHGNLLMQTNSVRVKHPAQGRYSSENCLVVFLICGITSNNNHTNV